MAFATSPESSCCMTRTTLAVSSRSDSCPSLPRADNASDRQIYDLKSATPSRELELWVTHIDRPHPHHTSHEQPRVWTASIAADRTIPSQRPALDLEPFFQQPRRQRTLRWLNLN